MSIGAPSNLGTLLIQRLDAALGATLGQQANVVSGAGPQAVPQPGSPENPNALRNTVQRDPQQSVDQANAEGQRRAAVGKATREMQLDNLLGRATTFRGATQSAPTTLGHAARIILALLNQFPEGQAAIQGKAPLLLPAIGRPADGAPSAPANQSQGAQGAANTSANAASATTRPAVSANQVWAQLATALDQPGALSARLSQALSQSVQNSGLFYESHLTQVAAGKLPAQLLRQEPQGQVQTQAQPSLSQGQTASGPASATPSSLSALVQQAQTSGPSSQQPNLPGTPIPTAPPAAPALPSPAAASAHALLAASIDPQVQQIVRQQLDVLAQQAFAWRGEAWPGTDMHWEVARRQPGDGQQPGTDAEFWSTGITIRLPVLGEVKARINLSGDQLLMRLTAPDSAPRLSEALEPLRSRLLAHGLQASQLSVHSQDPAPDALPPVPVLDDEPDETPAI